MIKPNNKLILKEHSQFDEAISLLDKNGNGVLPVVDKSNKFIGLITDGDIRKAILNKSLDLEHIINKNPFKLDAKSSINERYQFLKSVRRRHLPLVDSEGIYVGLFVMDDLEFNSKPNPVVIMAGGLGSRLGELTKETPKPMLHVGRKPILENIIEHFIEYGFHKFYLSVNYKSQKITDYFGDGKKWGIDITYLHEDKRLGTAGGLSLIEDELCVPIIVTNADIITAINYDELLDSHINNGGVATMCTREYEQAVPYGVIEASGGKIISLREKPSYSYNINAGIYVLDPEVIDKIPKDTFYDMPTVFEKLLEDKNEIRIFNIKDYWIDVGQVTEYYQANDDMSYNDYK